MPIATGTVHTPESPRAPNGYPWDQIAAATTREKAVALQEELTRHGYAPEGQAQLMVRVLLAESRDEVAAVSAIVTSGNYHPQSILAEFVASRLAAFTPAEG